LLKYDVTATDGMKPGDCHQKRTLATAAWQENAADLARFKAKTDALENGLVIVLADQLLDIEYGRHRLRFTLGGTAEIRAAHSVNAVGFQPLPRRSCAHRPACLR